MVNQFGEWLPDYPGQTPQQDPAYMQAVRRGVFPTINTGVNRQMQPQPQPSAQSRFVEVFPANSIDDVRAAHPPVGVTWVFFAGDDSFVGIKSVDVSGQEHVDIYDRRPPEPPAPVFEPSAYVRKDELPELISAAMLARSETPAAQRKSSKKEELDV